MGPLTPLETQVLELLLAGQSHWLAILRAQLEGAEVRSRELTGAGFFTDFSVSADAPTLPDKPKFQIGDVSADIEGLQHGAGFVLFVQEGVIAWLEGYSYDEPWPTEIGDFKVYYHEPRDEGRLTEALKLTTKH